VERDFTLSSGEILSVPTMVLTDSDTSFNYTETDDLQILELPYQGDDVSMVIILPKENKISIATDKLTKQNLSMWMDAMSPKSVNVLLPKFQFKTEYNLKTILIDMGLDIPFSVDADFSGMNGFGGLYIEKVLHKAFIEVNEKGTEAAAATTVHVAKYSIHDPVTVFDADHPFIFLIQHKETGSILFMGNMENPTA
jgi:serpin B